MCNCIIDIKKKIEIPQNNKSFFEIKDDENWKYSICLKIKISEEIDYINLFFIFKSYILNETLPIYSIAMCFKKKEDKRIVMEKERISKLKNISYDEFIEWVNFRFKKDWMYNESEEFYSILFICDKSIFNYLKSIKKINEVSDLKPIYPWNDKWLENIKFEIDKIKFLEKKIEFLENKIKGGV